MILHPVVSLQTTTNVNVRAKRRGGGHVKWATGEIMVVMMIDAFNELRLQDQGKMKKLFGWFRGSRQADTVAQVQPD